MRVGLAADRDAQGIRAKLRPEPGGHKTGGNRIRSNASEELPPRHRAHESFLRKPALRFLAVAEHADCLDPRALAELRVGVCQSEHRFVCGDDGEAPARPVALDAPLHTVGRIVQIGQVDRRCCAGGIEKDGVAAHVSSAQAEDRAEVVEGQYPVGGYFEASTCGIPKDHERHRMQIAYTLCESVQKPSSFKNIQHQYACDPQDTPDGETKQKRDPAVKEYVRWRLGG